MTSSNFRRQESDRTFIIIEIDRTIRPPRVLYGIGDGASYLSSAVTLDLGPFLQEYLLIRFEDIKN